PIERGAVGVVAVIDDEGRQPRQAGPGQSGAIGDVAADDGQLGRPELVSLLSIDERLQVGPAAGDQDADVHEVRNSTGASVVPASAAATWPTGKTCSPERSSTVTASATRSAGTQTSMPSPMLKVRRISSGATPPPRA